MSDPVLPRDLYRAADVRAIDRAAIETLQIPGIDLMERAGAAAFAALCERWPGARTLSAVCGSGNNGGDGYIVARLAHQAGWDVRVYPASAPTALQGDARSAYTRYRDAGGACLDFIPEDFEATEILVDALFGTGLNRALSGAPVDIIEAVNRYRARGLTHRSRQRAVVALDLPSGLQADSGARMGAAIQADLTVTFVALKQGLFTGAGPELTGDIIFDDLGIHPRARQGIQPSARRLQPDLIRLAPRPRSAHKGCFGHVLLIGGDQGYSGAIRLAAEAAARVGAGLVSVATRAAHAGLLNLHRPELMVHGVEHPADLEPLLERCSTVAIGPGLGRSAWARMLLEQTLATNLPLVVDADALNLLATSPVRRGQWILTPHPGEAARLLGCTAAEIQLDRFAASAELHRRWGGVIVLKGAGTLVQTEAQTPVVCQTGNPGMASGGMGDVLTGVLAGLLAQHFPLAEAAQTGVWLHGRAADLAAQAGERGLLAQDLMPHLRRLVNPTPGAPELP